MSESERKTLRLGKSVQPVMGKKPLRNRFHPAVEEAQAKKEKEAQASMDDQTTMPATQTMSSRNNTPSGLGRPAHRPTTNKESSREHAFRDKPRGPRSFDDQKPQGERSFSRTSTRPEGEKRDSFRDKPRGPRSFDDQKPQGERSFSRTSTRPEGEKRDSFRDKPRGPRSFDDQKPQGERSFSRTSTRPEGEKRDSFRDKPRGPRSFDDQKPQGERSFSRTSTRPEGEKRDSFRDKPRGPRSFDDQKPHDTGHSHSKPQAEHSSENLISERPAPPVLSSAVYVPKFSRTDMLAPRKTQKKQFSEHQDADGAIRLSRRMAEMGLCSRREADTYIERGWVKVNGVVVNVLGSRVLPKDQITLELEAQTALQKQVTILLHKPIGFVSGQAENGYRAAFALITPENRWADDDASVHFHPQHKQGLAPAGRLDIDSLGLLILTQDGRIAKTLIGENSNVEKEYLVRVEGTLTQNGLSLLNYGLSLDGEELKPATVVWQNEDQLKFILKEGKKRQIRRMCELVGLKVVGLKRVRIGNVKLGRLPLGKWRYLREDEHFD